jgi:Zn-dependent protease with chaperone function
MNFFSAQQQARTRTKWLVLWFALGVLATVACLYGVASWMEGFWGSLDGVDRVQGGGSWQVAEHPIAWWTALGAMVVIPLGSAFKLMQLSQGGSVVARDLGARPVNPATRDFSERQLLNVVEEMAIAAGIPMPQVWVMDDEPSINAFAAGTEPGNAVVGVSRGCLKKLTRSELQGVVAHEFSHILNGDMRLNMRLIGWVFGLLMIAMLGRGVLSTLRHVRFRGSNDSKGNGAVILLVLVSGVVLWLIGSLGVLFGRIIQSAISRQREYLADASAVQFTRDPSGIAGALKKIARGEGRIMAPKAGEAAHLFFSNGGGFLSGWLATHPPLDQRIRAIDPQWNGSLSEAKPNDAVTTTGASAFSGEAGESRAVNVEAAARLREQMRGQGEIASVAEACGLILALVSAGESVDTERGSKDLEDDVHAAWESWQGRCREMTSDQKIAWMDLAIPVLRQMSYEEYGVFRAQLRTWMERDAQVSLFEWMLHHALQRHLQAAFEPRAATPMRWHHIAQVEEAVADFLACLSSLSEDSQTNRRCREEYAHRVGRPLPEATVNFGGLEATVLLLDAASPEVKRQVLDLGKWVAESDGVRNDAERELLRAMADAIGAPLPPYTAGTSAAQGRAFLSSTSTLTGTTPRE